MVDWTVSDGFQVPEALATAAGGKTVADHCNNPWLVPDRAHTLSRYLPRALEENNEALARYETQTHLELLARACFFFLIAPLFFFDHRLR